MTQFAIARHASDDWRLVKWTDSSETEIGIWSSKPTMRECANALMEHHGSGNQPFSSREGTLDSLTVANKWPLPVRDMTVDGETMPFGDSN